MKKVIALNEKEIRVLTTCETAEKNNWWITHNLEVDLLPANFLTTETSTEPEVGLIWEGNKRFYQITKSEKVLICTICDTKANFRIGYRFYCKKHYKHLMLTRPIRRTIIQPGRNEPCSCGSGMKFKNCCIAKSDHKPRHYFNSRFMENHKMVKSFKNQLK
jgi:hypothetical protein